MVGRANRAQGIQTGQVFIQMNNAINPIETIKIIHDHDELTEDGFAAILVKAIDLEWANFSGAEKIRICEDLGGNKWQVTREKFETMLTVNLRGRLQKHFR